MEVFPSAIYDIAVGLTFFAPIPVSPFMEKQNADRPLPAYVTEVFETVQPPLASSNDGLLEDSVREHLRENGFETATIDAALDHLLLQGYLYEVDGQLRVTTGAP